MGEYRLPRWAWAVLRRLAPVVLTDDVEQMGLVDGAVREMERLLGAAPGTARGAFVAGLGGFDAGARALHAGRGFAALGLAEAEAYFSTWWHSPLPPVNQFAKGAKALLTFGYYELPGVQAQIGYDPQAWIDKVTTQRADEFGEEIARFEAGVLDRDPIPRTGPITDRKRTR